MPIHPQVSECLSLRINWRASVNLLIDQVSALVPTLFFVIVTLAQKSAPPFSSWAPVSTVLQDIHKPSVKSKTAYINMFPSFSLWGHNTHQHTPTHPTLSHAYTSSSIWVSVTQNQLESQCKSAHWSSLSSGANTFFRHCDTSLAQKSAPAFSSWAPVLQLYKTFTSQVSKARLPI